MKLINRSSFTLLPKQPFAEWVASLQGKVGDDEGYELLTLLQLREAGSIYLIDEVAQESDFTELLAQNWKPMFENELRAWDEFADYWPLITAEAFSLWFELQTNVMTFDLSSESLMTALLDD